MLTYANKLKDERDTLTGMAESLTERAATEERDLTEEELGQLGEWQARCVNIDAQLVTLKAQLDSQRAYAELRTKLDEGEPRRLTEGTPDEPRGLEGMRPGALATRQASWGDMFVRSEAFSNYAGIGTSARVEVPFDVRAAADPIKSTDLHLQPYQYNGPTPTEMFYLLNAVAHEVVSANSVEYLTWKPQPMTAAPKVPEATLKPPVDITVTPTSATLDTYAHYKDITRQALEDYPRLQSIVEDKLKVGILRALENGVTQALLAADVADMPGGYTAPNLLEGMRVGMSVIQGNGYTPTAVLMNPTDWATVDIDVMAASFSGPTQGGGFWSLRPIASPAIPVGTAYVGNPTTAITLFQRANAAVFVTDSHGDNFLKNVLTILAETRALAAVVEPAALVKLTVTP